MMEDLLPHEQWHLSKSVPISIILFLVAQTIGLVIWAVRLDYRVTSLEIAETRQDNRISMVDSLKDKIILIEERQNNVIRVLDANSKKLDTLLDQKTNNAR
jgi:hypothetical protein